MSSDTGATPGILRWDFAVRLVLAIILPVGGYVLAPDSASDLLLAAVMAALLVSFGTLGPEFTRPPLVAVTAVGVPLAVMSGAAVSQQGTVGAVLVLALFTGYGAMVSAGMVAQMAWFPVATAGMLASLLFSPESSQPTVAAGALLGSALAVALIAIVPLVLRVPRLSLPPEAVSVDTDLLRRMVTRPTWRDWAYPLALGGLSAGLLVLANVLTGGQKPYWAVLAFVSVLAPSKAQTRHHAVQTIVSTVIGVGIAAAILNAGLSVPAQALIIVIMGIVGALLMLSRGTLSKVLLTPLPVVPAAWALDIQGMLALELRLVEYVGGALVGIAAVVAAEVVLKRMHGPLESESPVA